MPVSSLVPWRFQSRHNFVKAHANFFFRQVLRTPPAPCSPLVDVSVHVLICQRDLHMGLLAMKSFLRFAPQVAAVLHDDGSLGEKACGLLRQHLPGTRVITRAEADAALTAHLPRDMVAARKRHVLLMKVFDVNFFSEGRRTIVLDSDILFRGAPDEALRWIAGDDGEVIYNPDPMRDTYRAPVRPPLPVPDWFNSGFLAYRHRIGLDEITQAIRTMDYALEDQTVYAYLLAGKPARVLDRTRYLVYEGGPIPESARMVHFISPDRFTDMTYVKLGREVCSLLLT
jgi:hypothetical protein